MVLLPSPLNHTHTHTPLFSSQIAWFAWTQLGLFSHTLPLKYPVERIRTADQMGRSSCRWEKRECGVRWREWGPRDCCLHQKDEQCICLKQTCVSTLTHAQPYAIFFLKWMSAWIGDIKAEALSSFTLMEPQCPTPEFLSRGTRRAAWKWRELQCLLEENRETFLYWRAEHLLQSHCVYSTTKPLCKRSSDRPTSPLFSV